MLSVGFWIASGLVLFAVLVAVPVYFVFRMSPIEGPLVYGGAYLGGDGSPRSSRRTIPMTLMRTGPAPLRELPEGVQRLLRETMDENPGYEQRYFSNEDAIDFLRSHCDRHVIEAFERVVPGAFKADIFRYAFMYHVGGVYSDLTQAFLVPLRELVRRDDTLVLVQDRYARDALLRPRAGIQISFMAGVPGLAIFKDALDMAVSNVLAGNYSSNPLAVTGPTLFAEVLDRHVADVNPRIGYRQDGRAWIVDAVSSRPVIRRRAQTGDVGTTSRSLWDHYACRWLTGRVFRPESGRLRKDRTSDGHGGRSM